MKKLLYFVGFESLIVTKHKIEPQFVNDEEELVAEINKRTRSDDIARQQGPRGKIESKSARICCGWDYTRNLQISWEVPKTPAGVVLVTLRCHFAIRRRRVIIMQWRTGGKQSHATNR